MVNLEKLQKLTPEEVEVVCAMQELAKTAKEMAELVREAYRFRFGEDKICIWKDEYNAEYLTHSGVWQARYLHQEYEVTCTMEKIFEYLVAEHIVKNKLHEEDSKYVEEDLKAFGYFRASIERIKQEHPELCHADEDT